jgi:hypothetical protein
MSINWSVFHDIIHGFPQAVWMNIIQSLILTSTRSLSERLRQKLLRLTKVSLPFDSLTLTFFYIGVMYVFFGECECNWLEVSRDFHYGNNDIKPFPVDRCVANGTWCHQSMANSNFSFSLRWNFPVTSCRLKVMQHSHTCAIMRNFSIFWRKSDPEIFSLCSPHQKGISLAKFLSNEPSNVKFGPAVRPPARE